MKLKERIKSLNNEIIYLGASSGWVFIGKKRGMKKALDEVDEQMIKALERKIEYYKAAIRKTEKEIANYVKFIDREVLDEYEKEYEYGLAVLVEGNEVGAYWTKEEYDNRRVSE